MKRQSPVSVRLSVAIQPVLCLSVRYNTASYRRHNATGHYQAAPPKELQTDSLLPDATDNCATASKHLPVPMLMSQLTDHRSAKQQRPDNNAPSAKKRTARPTRWLLPAACRPHPLLRSASNYWPLPAFPGLLQVLLSVLSGAKPVPRHHLLSGSSLLSGCHNPADQCCAHKPIRLLPLPFVLTYAR